jgi:hypothetical protein
MRRDRYLVVSIDVEPDCSPTWRYSDPLTYRGVEEGIGHVLQPLFVTHGVRPTYLVNNVVMEDEVSVAVLRTISSGCELGSHLHPEFIEPDKRVFRYAGAKAEANLCSLPPEIEFAKIQRITSLFRERFGFTPRAFRAGRFSAGSNTLRSLERLGYRVDSSVTPNVVWDDSTRESPVDFRTARVFPYLVGGAIQEEDIGGSLLEVPVSIAFVRRWFRQQLRWLRPKLSSFGALKAVSRACARAQADRPFDVLNMMFHNVEVLPGLSPYSRTERDCRRYLNTLQSFLRFALREGYVPVTLSELHERFRQR